MYCVNVINKVQCVGLGWEVSLHPGLSVIDLYVTPTPPAPATGCYEGAPFFVKHPIFNVFSISTFAFFLTLLKRPLKIISYDVDTQKR